MFLHSKNNNIMPFVFVFFVHLLSLLRNNKKKNDETANEKWEVTVQHNERLEKAFRRKRTNNTLSIIDSPN